jgi:tetratricopeptide (TPR) repeat protein
MKTIPFAFIFILFTQATFSQNHFEQAMDWYSKRTEGAVGYKADAKPISNAIEHFQKAMSEPGKELKAGVYLMRSYIFKGRFVYDKAEEKREVFEKAKVIGQQLVPKYPNDKELRFENLTAVGLWGETLGIFKAAREGIADRVKEEIETLIRLDKEFRKAIGQRALGALHLMAPNIPFIMSWPDKDYGLELTQSVVTRYPNDIGNNFFYAKALVQHDKEAAAIPYLEKALSMQPDSNYLLEDRHFKMRAEKLLREVQSQ